MEVMDIDTGGVEGGAEAVSPLVVRRWTLRELENVVKRWQGYARADWW